MFETYASLCLTAAAAGAINAIAGGGTLLTFPALLAALGMSAEATVIANATSSVALVPGSLASMWGYRNELGATRRWAALLALPSLLGGWLGARLVVAYPESFKAAIPWLILTAAALFAVQPLMARWMGIGRPSPHVSARTIVLVIVMQLCVAVYGGYFGAGIGILMLSTLAFMGLSDIHQMNGLKTLLAVLINGVSVGVFVVDGRVNWPFALAMSVAAILGGYSGARAARRLDRRVVRGTVVLIGVSLSAYYFYREFSG